MEFEKNLRDEYLRVYNEVVDELEVEEISIELTKEIKVDILDMFLSAQQDGESPSGIVGESSREFVLELVKDFNKSNSGLFRVGQYVACTILGIGALSLFNIKNGVLHFDIDILVCLLITISGDAIGRILSRKYNVGKTRSRSKNKIRWGYVSVMTILGVAITNNLNLPTLFVFNLPFVFIAGCIASALLLEVLLEQKFS
ncbi:MAG: hypothetical protein ACRCWG_12595 [Sarcina sp.]